MATYVIHTGLIQLFFFKDNFLVLSQQAKTKDKRRQKVFLTYFLINRFIGKPSRKKILYYWHSVRNKCKSVENTLKGQFKGTTFEMVVKIYSESLQQLGVFRHLDVVKMIWLD